MKITDTVEPTDYTVLTTAGENEVHLRVVDSGRRGRNALAQLPRAEFIRAIETELDGTWIDHADLPTITEAPGPKYTASDGTQWTYSAHWTLPTPADLRENAAPYLALARYLEANPPVDAAAVDALAKTLNDNDLGNRLARADLERLVQAGVRAPEAGENR